MAEQCGSAQTTGKEHERAADYEIPREGLLKRTWNAAKGVAHSLNPFTSMSGVLFRGQWHLEQCTDFQSICELAVDVLLKCKEGDCDEVKELQRLLKHKEILITVSGRHNSGKSTLLNALLGFKILPYQDMDETAISVLITHDATVHDHRQNCDCTQSCIDTDNEKCPKLTFEEGDPIRGVKAIHDKLKELNKASRERSQHALKCTVTLNVKVLDHHPSGWSVSLMDTPGFGENNPAVTTVAERALKLGSAYVYVVNKGTASDTVDAQYYSQLKQDDEDVFTEDRFLTVVTKFDLTYEEDEPVHFDKVKSKVQGNIAIATKSVTPDIAVIKVSGKWAYEACMLESLPTSVNLRWKAARSLSSYHGAMGGQGESHTSLPSDELVKQLKDASDISQVEMRIRKMSENCAVLWAKKLAGGLSRNLESAAKSMCTSAAEIETTIEEQLEKHSQITQQLKDLEDKRRALKTFVDGVRDHMDQAYEKDLEQFQPKERGRKLIHLLVADLDQRCEKKVVNKEEHFSPATFNAEVKQFLRNTGVKLEAEFNGTAQFPTCQHVLMWAGERIAEGYSDMRIIIGPLLNRTDVICTRERGPLDVDVPQTFDFPKLLDLKASKDYKIPPVSLTFFQRLMKFFRELFGLNRNPSVGGHVCTLDGGTTTAVSANEEGDKNDVVNEPGATGGAITSTQHRDEVEAPTSEPEDTDQLSDDDYMNPSDITPVIKMLEEDLIEQSDKYFDTIKEPVVDYFCDASRKKHKDRMKEFESQFKEDLDKKRQEADCLLRQMERNKHDVERMKNNSTYLLQVKDRLLQK